jgi:hypothetical protein
VAVVVAVAMLQVQVVVLAVVVLVMLVKEVLLEVLEHQVKVLLAERQQQLHLASLMVVAVVVQVQ